jgi:hypothetical protein
MAQSFLQRSLGTETQECFWTPAAHAGRSLCGYIIGFFIVQHLLTQDIVEIMPIQGLVDWCQHIPSKEGIHQHDVEYSKKDFLVPLLEVGLAAEANTQSSMLITLVNPKHVLVVAFD